MQTPPLVPVWEVENGTPSSEFLMFTFWNIIALLSILKIKYFTTMYQKHVRSPESRSLSCEQRFRLRRPCTRRAGESHHVPSTLLLNFPYLCSHHFLPRSHVHSASPLCHAPVGPWPVTSSFEIASVISLIWYLTDVTSWPQRLCWVLQASVFHMLTDVSWEPSHPLFLSVSLHPGFCDLVKQSCSSCSEQASPTMVLEIVTCFPLP